MCIFFIKNFIMIHKKQEEIVRFATETINMEIEALRQMAGFVDADFVKSVNTIYNSEGRVVVTGIGKSAIIGSKIVATLNSTGTPAIFMHAADAIHGDLGIIQKNDVVICISKSGNTPEIKVLVPLIRNINNNNPIIAMVGNTESFLATNSDMVINTWVAHEACPNNLAPTSSTTAQLVMGDAVAMALLRMKGFTADDFAKVHPGGALGKRLYVRVSDLTNLAQAPKVTPLTPIKQVIVEISSKRVGSAAVLCDEGAVCGIITDGDIRRMLEHNDDISHIKACDIMCPTPKIIEESELAVKAFTLMESNQISQLIVTNSSGEYKGIIHVHAILSEGVV